MAATIVVAALGLAFIALQHIQHNRTVVRISMDYAANIAAERGRVNDLIAQVQANAQGFQHYPTIGPLEPVEEKKYLTDDTGLIVFEVEDDDDEADFEAVTG
jgi:hypothetical protein